MTEDKRRRMYGTGTKKMLNMLILEILRDYTDEDHSLMQKEIVEKLREDYGMECDRRSVQHNIQSLMEMGYEIATDGGYRLLDRTFDTAELRMLIDSVLFSKSLTEKQAKDLVGKLRSMGNKYFSAGVENITNLPDFSRGDNPQLLYVLDTVNRAISDHRKIEFFYNVYGTDLKLHHKREEKYRVNPYRIIANNGRYYLIGNYDKYDDISHYRIDRMTEVTELPEQGKPVDSLPGYEHGIDLPKHMAEHIYMFSGKSVTVTMLADEHLLGELVDWFGKEFHILGTEADGRISVRVRCNEQAMFYWALQYGLYAEIQKPESLRRQIADAVSAMNEKYREKKE